MSLALYRYRGSTPSLPAVHDCQRITDEELIAAPPTLSGTRRRTACGPARASVAAFTWATRPATRPTCGSIRPVDHDPRGGAM